MEFDHFSKIKRHLSPHKGDSACFNSNSLSTLLFIAESKARRGAASRHLQVLLGKSRVLLRTKDASHCIRIERTEKCKRGS